MRTMVQNIIMKSLQYFGADPFAIVEAPFLAMRQGP